MKFKHELVPITIMLKSRSIGWSSQNNPHLTNMKKCKHCSYVLFSGSSEFQDNGCISDEEKIIKKLLE